jgi:hypothetical protein
MPHISTEALVGAALVVLLAVGYQYIPKANAPARKKKTKRRAKASTATAVATPSNAPGADTASKERAIATSKGVSRSTITTRDGSSEPNLSSESSDQPSSFSAAAKIPPAAPQQRPKTLAEKIAPKPRKTKVDE